MNFNFKNDYVLENDFVRLSPLQIHHVDELLSIANEPNLWTYFIENGKGRNNLFKYVNHTITKRIDKQEYPFIIYDKARNEYAGTTRFYEYSEELKTIKLGHTWIGKKFRGTGLNKQCKFLLFEFAFEQINLERIGFGVHQDNKTSLAAMKSVGCMEEGQLRNFLPSIDGISRANIVLFSIIKKEWREKVKAKLKERINTKNNIL